MRKFIVIGLSSLFVISAISLFTISNTQVSSSEEEIVVSDVGHAVDEEYIEKLNEENMRLAQFMTSRLEGTNVRLTTIENVIEKVPNRLLHVEAVSLDVNDDIEVIVDEVIQEAVTESIIQEDELYEIIIKD
ncbi:hypothetical protein [Halalkalibacter flavus]|uniref:hypothetical protein n=1 Tax=Halalkalibacter flavus TaxID=3090668 RepID=UPI002FC68C9C